MPRCLIDKVFRLPACLVDQAYRFGINRGRAIRILAAVNEENRSVHEAIGVGLCCVLGTPCVRPCALLGTATPGISLIETGASDNRNESGKTSVLGEDHLRNYTSH